MPRNPKYPLEPLREHRDRAVEAATTELGDAVRARESADEAKARAERERREEAVKVDAVKAEEQKRLSGGELRAVDLARAEAWGYATSRKSDRLMRAVARTEEELTAALEAEALARGLLAQKKAERDVIAKDEGKFVESVARSREAAEEEQAEDVVAARRKERG